MDKFKMIYNILTDICKVALKHKDATLNDDMGGKMMEEFKTAFAKYPEKEHKLAVAIADAVMKYLFE